MKKHLPSFINPKTGRRFTNYLAPIPGLNRPITEVTIEEFILAQVPPRITSVKKEDDQREARNKHQQNWSDYFDQIGWPEGFSYCQNEQYLRSTGFPAMLKAAHSSSGD